MSGFLTWLHAQLTALVSTGAAVIGNQPAPARQVFVYTLVLIALVWAVPKIVKAVKK